MTDVRRRTAALLFAGLMAAATALGASAAFAAPAAPALTSTVVVADG